MIVALPRSLLMTKHDERGKQDRWVVAALCAWDVRYVWPVLALIDEGGKTKQGRLNRSYFDSSQVSLTHHLADHILIFFTISIL